MLWLFIPACAQVKQSTPADSSQQIAKRIVNSEIPVLVDFWAPWCMPCRMLNPIISELKKKYAGKIEVIKVNTDINRGLAAYFGITGIPAVFIVKDKTVVKAIPGLQPKENYENAVKEVLSMPPEKKQKNEKAEADSTEKT
ncbi:MAG: thioredoxin [Chitinivibrionales bacterium]|nr:thioredoxin [Chitinivibrionales bacterium]